MDIFKCFDQVKGRLLRRLLQESGCPERIVEPYMRYLEQLEIYNLVAGTLGAPHALWTTDCFMGCTVALRVLFPFVGAILHIWVNCSGIA